VERSEKWRRVKIAVWGASVAAMTVLAIATLHAWKPGAVFLLGLTTAGAILVAVGNALLKIAGRRRPGRHTVSRFVALAAGVMVVTASWLGPAAVVRAIQDSLPMLRADLFLFAVGPDQAAALVQILERDPDVKTPVELLPVVILRLAKVSGVPPREGVPERWTATCSNAWRTDAPEVVISESIAGTLGARVGATLEFYSNAKRVAARVTGLRRLDAIEDQRGGLLFPCQSFAGLSVFYEAGIAVKEGRVDAVRRAIAERYPSVPVVQREEVTAAIQSVTNESLWMLRAVSLLILAAGMAALVLMVMAEERTRTREIAILKMLGARPRQLRNGLMAEFAWLGGLAGMSGGLVGSGFATLLLSVVFRKPVGAWDARVIAGAIVLGVTTAAGAGWASSAGMLRRRPLVVLREE
jgi:putative ABC transport system permease protein